MTFPRKTLIATLIAAVAIAGALWLAGSSESQYEGRPVSYWLKEYGHERSLELFERNIWDALGAESLADQKALEPFRVLGTNAVPCLIATALDTAVDSPARTAVGRFFAWLHRRPGSYVSRESMAAAALGALLELKPPAAQLLPLIRRSMSSRNPLIHRRVLELLGDLSDGAEQAVPYLAMALKEPDADTRLAALAALDRLGPKSAAAVPTLMDCLVASRNDTNQTAYSVALALGKIGSNAAPALPLVEDLFSRETNDGARAFLACALCQIGGSQSRGFDYLVKRATNGDYFAQYNLIQVGPNARPALTALLNMVTFQANTLSWIYAVQAVENMGLPTADYMPALKQRLARSSDMEKEYAAELILAVEPSDPDAMTALGQLLELETRTSERAAFALARAGPAAQTAVPALKSALNSHSDAEREAAAWALKKIQAPAKSNDAVPGSRPAWRSPAQVHQPGKSSFSVSQASLPSVKSRSIPIRVFFASLRLCVNTVLYPSFRLPFLGLVSHLFGLNFAAKHIFPKKCGLPMETGFQCRRAPR